MPSLTRAILLSWLFAVPLSAFANDDPKTIEIEGSSGKFMAEKDAACAAAQGDARQSAATRCAREGGGVAGDPQFAPCRCEQGGFGGEEWLCSTVARFSCEVGEEPGASREALKLELPDDLTHLELLDRVFVRRGFTLPTAVVEQRLASACEAGWKLACAAPNWKEGTRFQLAAAEKDLQRACEAGDVDGCIAWGWALEERAIAHSMPSLFIQAARRYKGLCDGRKHPTACYDYGTILFNELGVKADPRLGLKRWDQACSLGEGAACSALAKVYRSGYKTKADPKKAASYAQKGCSLGDPAGCIEEARLSGDRVATQDLQARACTLGGVKACWELASSSFGMEPMPPRVRELLAMGCDLGDGAACAKAGQFALRDNDDEEAARRFQTACAVDQVSACAGLAQMVMDGRLDADVEDHLYAFEVACSRADLSTACSELGLALLEGDSSLSNQARARALLRQSCTDANSPARSCFVLGDLYENGKGGERDRTLAAKYYKWACAQGWGQACERRGDLLAEGVGVRRNHAEAVIMYQSGCDAGLATSCFRAGVLLDEGTYIPRDARRAKELFATACERGVGEACLRHGMLALDEAAGRDEAEARASFESAVQLGNVEAHRRLAYLLWNGLGGKKDKKRAKALTAAGCKQDDPVACRGPAFQTED